MDEASTKQAFTVLAGTAPVAGKVAFAEDDTVLVFQPAKPLPYGTKVVITVATTARSRDGAPLGAAAKGAFRTVPKPVAARPTVAKTHRRRQHRRRWRRRRRSAAARSAAARGRRSRRTTSA